MLTDAQTVAGDDLADAQAADLQIDTYSKAESDAYQTQTKNDALALDTLIKGDADALKAKAATADGSFRSSWMDAWSAETSADDTKQDANADNALNKTDGAADALDIKEKGEADAEQTKADGDAQTIHDKIVGDAQTAHDHAIGDANNITSAVAKDAYFATLPEAYAAFDWGSVANPAVLDAGYDEVYAVDDVAMPLAAGQDDGASPLPGGDVIGAMSITPAIGPGSAGNGLSAVPPGTAETLGQAFSLAGTVDPYGSISGMTTFTGPSLLWDNGAYAPANPNLGYAGWAGAPWLNVGQTLPTSGGGGSPTMPPPQTPGGGGSGSGSGGQQQTKAPPVPKENDLAIRMLANVDEANRVRPASPAGGDLLKEEQAAERGMTIEEFEAENEKGWLRNKQAMQGNADSLQTENNLNVKGVFGRLRGAVELGRNPVNKALSKLGVPPPPTATPDAVESVLDAMDIIDRAAKNWRQNRATGSGVVKSAAVVGGTFAGDVTGVTSVSNARARHEAVNAEREQTLAEQVVQGATGGVQLVLTAIGFVGVGNAAASKLGIAKPKIPGPKGLTPGVIEAELAEPAVVSKSAATGETQATRTGKAIHSQLAEQRRASGEWDLVNEQITSQAGETIEVPSRVNLNTGEPAPGSGTQPARPDAVRFSDATILDDKPLNRPLAKDRQEVIRFIDAYKQREGRLPDRIVIQWYDPVTGLPVRTDIFPPSFFLP